MCETDDDARREAHLPATWTPPARDEETGLPAEWEHSRSPVRVPSQRLLPEPRQLGQLRPHDAGAGLLWEDDGYDVALDPWAATHAHRVAVSGVAYSWVRQSQAQPLRVHASARYRTAVGNVALTVRLVLLLAVSTVVLLVAVQLIRWLT
jgi:hypothetical protein